LDDPLLGKLYWFGATHSITNEEKSDWRIEGILKLLQGSKRIVTFP
jgi:hypothetical protein